MTNGVKTSMLKTLRDDAKALYDGAQFSDERFKRFVGGSIGLICDIAEGYQDPVEIGKRIDKKIAEHMSTCKAVGSEKPDNIKEALLLSLLQCPKATAIVVAAYILREVLVGALRGGA